MFNDLTCRNSKPNFGDTRINWDNPITQGLVGAWAFNEGSGTSITDAVSKTVSTFTGATWNGCDLVTTRASGNGAILPSVGLTDKITVMVCSTMATSAADSHLISRYNGWVMSGDGTNMRFRIDGAVNVSFGSIASLRDSKQHTFSGVYDGANVTTYTDGVFVASSARTGNMTLSGNTTLATYNGGTGFEWDGTIKYALIFNRALSASEVASLSANPYQIYEGERTRQVYRTFTQKPPIGTGIDWSHPLSNGLVGCWLFNEGGGTTPIDLCGQTVAGLQGTPSLNVSGYLGNASSAFKINRKSGYILTRSSPATIFAIITQTTRTRSGLVCIGTVTDSAYNISLDINTDGTLRQDTEGISFGPCGSTLVVPTNVKSTVALSQTSATSRLFFVDGVFQSNSGSIGSQPSSGGLAIGGTYLNNTWGSNSGFIGTIHTVYIFNRALNADEIKALSDNPYQICLAPTVPDKIVEAPITKYRGGRR